MTAREAIDYLTAHGETIKPAPRRYKSFQYYAVEAMQCLTTAQLIEYASNERALREPVRPFSASQEAE